MSVNLHNIVGNEALKERLSDEIEKKTFSHAYIIEGPKGSGRHTLALNISAALSCLDEKDIPCGNCKNCKKILSSASPDIIVFGLEDGKASIGVETVRKLKDDISTAPNDLNIKIYVIEDADLMTVQAQNAFLLSLEEPPEYVIFLLICENSGELLETVRSRAPVLRLMRLHDSDLREHILKNDKRAMQLLDDDPEAFEAIIFISDGCVGKALSLLDAKNRKNLFEERATAEQMIRSLSAHDREKVLQLIFSLGKKRTDVLACLSLMQYAIRDLLLLKKTDAAKLCFYPVREKAQELSTHYTSASLSSLYDALSVACDELESNANVRVALLNMALKAGLI